jgi:uncharacterized protein GlcG (DUF336 family)
MERTVNVWEPLWFSGRARLIAGLGQQPRRVKRQAHDPLIERKITSAHVGDLTLVTAMHEALPRTRFGDPISAAALPVPAQHQVVDHVRDSARWQVTRQFNDPDHGLSVATALGCCVTVEIIDEPLTPRALMRMDGTDMITAGLATGRAWPAAANGPLTAVWRGLASADCFLGATIPVALDRPLDGPMLFAGGYPLRADGWTLGGVGASGGHEQQDDPIARGVLGTLLQLQQFTSAHGHG